MTDTQFPSSDSNAADRRQERAGVIALVTLVGMSMALAYHAFRGFYLHQPYPYNTFLYMPVDRFSDFYNYLIPLRSGSPYYSPQNVYPPFAYLPLLPLLPLGNMAACLLLCGVFLGTTCWFLYRYLDFLPVRRRLLYAFLVGACTYPFLMNVDRGNLEMLVFVFLAGFVVCFSTQRWGWSAVFLGCAAATKAYPIVFLALYYRRPGYKALMARVVALAGLLTLGGAYAYPGGAAATLRILAANLKVVTEEFAIGNQGLRFSSCYYTFSKILLLSWGVISPASMHRFYSIYSLCCIPVFLFVLYFVLFRETVLWKQAALLTFSIILLPQISIDYKLIHLLLPIALFVSDRRPSSSRKMDLAYACLFGLLLVPKAYAQVVADVNVGVFINPLLMTVLGAMIVRENYVGDKATARTPSLPTPHPALTHPYQHGG